MKKYDKQNTTSAGIRFLTAQEAREQGYTASELKTLARSLIRIANTNSADEVRYRPSVKAQEDSVCTLYGLQNFNRDKNFEAARHFFNIAKSLPYG